MKTAKTETVSFFGTITVDVTKIQNLLCCAMEGGSNYWIDRVRVVLPADHTTDDYKVGGRFNIDDLFDTPLYNVWRFTGGKVRIFFDINEDGNLKEYTLDLQAAINGLRLMKEAKKCRPVFWTDFEKENEDADTADCWLQLALFGEIVFA